MTSIYARCACCSAPTSIPEDRNAFAYCEPCSLLGHWQEMTYEVHRGHGWAGGRLVGPCATAHAVRVSCGY